MPTTNVRKPQREPHINPIRMPGATAKSMKKGISHVAQMRKDANKKMVKAAVEGELEGCTFGRVVKHLGNGQVQLLDYEKHDAIGVIRGLLRRKGVTPVCTGDVVIISERDFERKTGRKTYDIVGIADGAAASALQKAGTIPEWMTALGEAVGGAGAKDDIEFDYSAEEDVDIDAI